MSRKHLIVIILLLVILLLSGIFVRKSHFSRFGETFSVQKSGKIFRNVYVVIDGDTFWMKYENGEIEKIRLIGIDAPEARKSEHKDIQYFGKESKEFLRKFLKGKKVTFEYDVQKRDQYGRTLAYVYLEDSTFLNDYLVRNGYTRVYTFPPNVKHQKQFTRSERYARENKLGLWK